VHTSFSREVIMLGFLRKRTPSTPEASLNDIELHLREIPGALSTADAIPRIDWTKVREAIVPHANHAAINQLWTELAAQWLGILAVHLAGSYEIYEGSHLLLLCARPVGESKRLLRLADDAYDRLARMINPNPGSGCPGKRAIIILDKTSLYYDYISYFYADSDRAYGASVGMHTSRGYGHIVLNGNSKSMLQTLVHELAHALVADRPLPVWLNEGLAQFVEDMVPGYRAPFINARDVRLHRRYWSWFGTAHFWTGAGFKGAASQRLSYQLAEILFRNLVTDRDRRRSVSTFLATAHREDAGAKACREAFGCQLPTLVEEFLGPGSWGPIDNPEP